MEKRAHAPTRELLTYFDALHVEYLSERAVINGGKDAKLLAALCASHGPERVKELMRLYFESDDDWIQNAGYSVGLFVSQCPKLIAQQRKALQLTGRAGYNVREAQAALGAMDGSGAARTAREGVDALGRGDTREDRPGHLRALRRGHE